MSETNKANTVAFYKKALFEGDVQNAFRSYAGSTYRQHNPLIEDGMEGVRKFVAWIMANHPDAFAGLLTFGQAAYQGNSLTPAQRELAYLTASVTNDCHY